MKYFVIEGVDGSGKSTQHQILKERTKEKKIDSLFINEPGGSKLGEIVRGLILNQNLNLSDRASFLLFLAQRAEIAKLIATQNKIIISDRSLISGIAYANKLDLKEALQLNLFATNYILPQKIIFLEINKQELQKRLDSKNKDNIEIRGLEYLLNIQERFKTLLNLLQDEKFLDSIKQDKKLSPPKILRLNASLEQDEIANKIFKFLFE